MDLRRLPATIKARWVCEQAHQQLKEELGLDHFEGRSWQGLYRPALITILQYCRLGKMPREKRINGPPPQPTLPAVRRAIVALTVQTRSQRCPNCRIARRLNDGGCGNRSEARLCHLGFGIAFHLDYSGGPIMTVTWLLSASRMLKNGVYAAIWA
jgi:hypothetical protein